MQNNPVKKVALMLAVLAAIWVAAAYLLGRNGFTWSNRELFDWAGLIFTGIPLVIAATVYQRAKKRIKGYRHEELFQ